MQRHRIGAGRVDQPQLLQTAQMFLAAVPGILRRRALKNSQLIENGQLGGDQVLAQTQQQPIQRGGRLHGGQHSGQWLAALMQRQKETQQQRVAARKSEQLLLLERGKLDVGRLQQLGYMVCGQRGQRDQPVGFGLKEQPLANQQNRNDAAGGPHQVIQKGA